MRSPRQSATAFPSSHEVMSRGCGKMGVSGAKGESLVVEGFDGHVARADGRGDELVRVDDGADVGAGEHDGDVEHGLAGRHGRVDDTAALLAGVPLASGARGVGIEVDLYEVSGGDLVVGLQDRLDEHPVGAGNAGADVAVEVDEALMVEDAGAICHLLLEASDFGLGGHGGPFCRGVSGCVGV